MGDKHERIMAEAERIKALGEASESVAPYPVNQATIGTWLDAMGYDNERFRQGEAPPSMAQVWTMPGLGRKRPPEDPLSRMTEFLTDEGYTAVLGTNCEQSYERYLRVGEEVRVTSALDSVAGPKNTAMGEGYFVTSRNTWYVGDEVVATMLFRVLKFIPKGELVTVRPMVNRDSQFFWDGTRAGELRIQKCNACGAKRFPPGPACQSCAAYDRGYDVAAGTGTVFSYVVHRHPPVPGKELPIVIALIDLDEGVRMVGEVVDVADDEIEIGMPLRVDFREIDDELTLPVWRKA